LFLTLPTVSERYFLDCLTSLLEGDIMSELVPVLSQTDIQAKVKSLAHEISADYTGKSLVAIGVLKGAFIFLADLVRHISVPTQIDFVRLASYGADIKSSGKVRITKDIELDIKGKDVLVVEDIIDSGLTLTFLVEHLKKFNPLSVKVCALIDKTERREKEVPVDYTGFTIESGFLVGYGLDCNEDYRGLPDINNLKL
jgi:hypoxanthine phosphoribosyltransferase